MCCQWTYQQRYLLNTLPPTEILHLEPMVVQLTATLQANMLPTSCSHLLPPASSRRCRELESPSSRPTTALVPCSSSFSCKMAGTSFTPATSDTSHRCAATRLWSTYRALMRFTSTRPTANPSMFSPRSPLPSLPSSTAAAFSSICLARLSSLGLTRSVAYPNRTR